MSELDVVAGAVLATVGGGALQVVAAPIQGVADHIRDRVKQRLDRTQEFAEVKAAGTPIKVSDRVAYKALTEAAFTDDALTSEYLGGVLAASGPDERLSR